MAKKESSRHHSVEIQKGPIRMEDQYTEKFCRAPERMMRDIEENRMRQDKMTMTFHTPKQ